MILPWTKNQSLTLTEQLEKGVRSFDFRISYSTTDGQLYLSHTLLTEHTATSIFHDLFQFLNRSPDQPFLTLNLRVDYNARPHQSIIQPIMTGLLNYYANSIMTHSDLYDHDKKREWKDISLTQKVLIYCSDGTIQHPFVFSSELMPTVAFWNAGTVEECERRLQNIEEEFVKQMNGPFLFPKERMLMFDFSNNYPLWITDYQQFQLMEQYKALIIGAKPTILAGNHVQKIMEMF
jgi:hypothetical protein